MSWFHLLIGSIAIEPSDRCMAGLMALMGGQRQSRLRKRDNDAAAPMPEPRQTRFFSHRHWSQRKGKRQEPSLGEHGREMAQNESGW